jgi:hypothetical protein
MFLACLCLLLVSGFDLFATEMAHTPLRGTVSHTDRTQSIASACQFGNLNDPAHVVYGWNWGNETFVSLFDAESADCVCPEGFRVTGVHIYMRFLELDVPFAFDCKVDFRETIFDDATGCQIPGPTICESSVHTVTIETPGVIDIGLPIDTEANPCAHFGYKYAVGFTILSDFETSPELVTDDMPVGCTGYTDKHGFWEDLTGDAFFPGELIMYADVECCSGPTGNESRSWGEVKSLFR